MNMLFLPEGPGWSPDVGRFWVKNGKAYWHDGDITDLSVEGKVFRTGLNSQHGEDYSAWSDEKRAEVKQAFAIAREAQEKAIAEEDAKNKVLIESARFKLSEDEFDAVARSGHSLNWRP